MMKEEITIYLKGREICIIHQDGLKDSGKIVQVVDQGVFLKKENGAFLFIPFTSIKKIVIKKIN